jgi:transposase
MFTLSSHHKFNLFSQPTDMRKGFNGLSGIVNHILKDNPRSGEVFIFINKRRNKIKLLQWQGGGFVLYYKRLEQGAFELPEYEELAGSIVLSYTKMAMIVDGLSIKNIASRKRFNPVNSTVIA